MINEQAPPLRLPRALVADGVWRVSARAPAAPDFIRHTPEQSKLLAGETTFTGATLRAAGLNMPMLRPESGMVLEFERVKRG